MLAAIYCEESAVVTLLQSGADKTLRDKYGYTASQKASNRGYHSLSSFIDNFQYKNPISHIKLQPSLPQLTLLTNSTAASLPRRFDPATYHIAQEYPFYTSTQCFLFSLFGNFDVPDLDYYIRPFSFYNFNDDKATTQANAGSFELRAKEISDTLDKQKKQTAQNN